MIDNELISKIKTMYGALGDEVISKFETYAKSDEWISHTKVLNAVLKLSNGDISKLNKYLELAGIDPRDVVMLAEKS
jgi:hypothetical protein